MKELCATPTHRPECVGPGRHGLGEGAIATPFLLLAMLHEEDWETVFEIYAGRPGAALNLASHLMDIRKLLQRGSRGNAEAIAAIDAALGALYEHTSFNRVGQKFYQLKSGISERRGGHQVTQKLIKTTLPQ